MELKDKCFEIRRILQISQYDLAKKLGTNQTKISLIEAGYLPKDKDISQKIEKLYRRYFNKIETYSELLEIVDNDENVEYILDYDDFAVVKIDDNYWYFEQGENDCDTFGKVEIMAELTYDANNDLQIKDASILHALFDCYCCGEYVNDNNIQYLWFKAVV